MARLDKINKRIQQQLADNNLSEIDAVTAAEWLDEANILKDSPTRPGKNLRDLLRAQKITGQYQQANGRWFICKVTQDKTTPSIELAPDPSSSVHSFRDNRLPNTILPDFLAPGLNIVFVGTAVGDESAKHQHYYSHPTNCFYKSLHDSGLTKVRLTPVEDYRLLDFNIGLTDLVKNEHSGSDRCIELGEPNDIIMLRNKISEYHPRIVCFNGKTAFQAFFSKRPESYGLSTKTIGDSLVFVVPSTSGRVRANKLLDGKTRAQWFKSLSELKDVDL